MKKRSGFTLIEIAIFLAITGLLFVGITVGTNNSVIQQRFTDSVQNFAEFLRSVYSEVSNPQSIGDGRSERAIYGKLVTFGEAYGLDGELNTDNKIFVYDIIGSVGGDLSSGNINQALYNLGANAIINEDDKLSPAGIAESYTPRWASKIESIDSSDNIKTAVLVVRHPRSGTINTLVLEGNTIQINEAIRNHVLDPLAEYLKTNQFVSADIDFCVDPEENFNKRQNVRIVANAHNATGIEIIPMDDEDNRCRQ